MELYKFSRLVMHLNSFSMDLGRDTASQNSALFFFTLKERHLFTLSNLSFPFSGVLF